LLRKNASALSDEQRGEKKSLPYYERTQKQKDRRIIKLIAVDKLTGTKATAALNTLSKDWP
jgi:hypothetical protein